ncbi:carboxypeptidase regulatory-like domain-containing protein [bacterium]|nr:carboxypeptidase regulatory-like domain-containing protein [bacterium]
MMKRHTGWFLFLVIFATMGFAYAQADSIAPNVNIIRPADGETLYFDGGWFCGAAYPESTYSVNYYDYSPSSGLDTTTIVVKIRECGGTSWNFINNYNSTFGFEYGSVYGSLNSLGLEFGKCYQFCSSIYDNMDNLGESCITFYTQPPIDDCPPQLVAWEPLDTHCIAINSDIHLVVCDNSIDCETVSGVNAATAYVTLQIGTGAPSNVTSQCTFSSGGMHCLDIHWNHTGGNFPYNEEITMCVSVDDSAGNHMDTQCHSWFTCEPEDTCPPVISWIKPFNGDTVFPDGPFWWAHDSFGYADTSWYVQFTEYGCPATGIDTTSLHIYFGLCGTSLDEIPPGYANLMGWDYGDASGSMNSLGLELGQCYTLCAEISDNNGNTAYDCTEFYTPPPPDTCPPYVSEWHPSEEETLCPPTADIWFTIIDPNTEICECSGINYVEAELTNGDSVYNLFIGEGLIRDDLDSCSSRFFLDNAYYNLEPGTWANLQVHAYDYAGHSIFDDINFFVCPPADTCPPVVNINSPLPAETLFYDGGWWRPGTYPDSTWAAYFEEFSCPGTGLDTTTLEVSIRMCDDTSWIVILDYTTYWGYDLSYGNVNGSLNSLGLEPGFCYELCVEINDNFGNHGGDCVNFYTEPELEDTCPPYVTYWEPFDGDTGVDPMACVRAAYLVDPSGPGCVYSGVDTSSYHMIAIINGDTLDVTHEIITYYNEVYWCHDSVPLPSGAHIVVCLDFADYADNWSHECIEFDVEGEAPEDSCPPFVDHWFPPNDSCIPVDAMLGAYVCENMECPYSTINPDSITVTVSVAGGTYEDITSECAIELSGECYNISWNRTGASPLPYSSVVTLCLRVVDYAGNVMEECNEWTTCGEETVDVCAPYVSEWHPSEFDTSCWDPHENIWFNIVDPYDSVECPVCTGIDHSSLEVHLYNNDSTYVLFDGGGLILDDFDHCGLYVGLDDAYYMLTPGTGATLCVSGTDIAGNDFGDCITFFVCDTAVGDTCPPELTWESPESLETLIWEDGQWFSSIGDTAFGLNFYEFGCPGTGLDTASLHIWIRNCDDTFSTEVYGYFAHFGWDYGYAYGSFSLIDLAPGECYVLCAEITDLAGNTGYDCVAFFTGDIPDTVDECSPSVVEWHPGEFDTLCPPSADIWFRIIDPAGSGDCPVCSGIDRSSLEVHLYNDGLTYGMFYGGGLIVESFGDCGVDVALDDAYYMLTPGTGATLCVSGTDIAGNDFGDCITFFVCDTAVGDTCPPELSWYSPGEGETLFFAYDMWWSSHDTYMDSSFTLNISEFGCPGSGLDTASLRIWISTCDDSEFSEIDGYYTYLGWDYGTAIGSFNILDLSPNECYVLCAEITDLAGNTGYDCVTFFTGDIPDTVDYCPPEIVSWFPDADTCLPTDSPLGFVITDPYSDICPIASGVDLLSITVTAFIGSDTLNITGECDFATEGDYIGVSWSHTGMALPEGETIVLCVSASDLAGNSMTECYDWRTCGGVEDVCSPMAELEYPDTLICIPADTGSIIIDVYDIYDSIECPVPTGVDSSSIVVNLYIEDSVYDITDECYLYSFYTGYRIYWFYSGLEPGSEIMICVDASDYAGNDLYPPACFSWDVCGEVEDTCPPTVDWISIYDGRDGVPVDEFVGFDLFDPHGSEECPICTGIDTESVVMRLITETDTMEYPLSEMNWTASECMLSAWLDTSFRFDYETEYTMCIDASDNAGNVMETYCVHFTTEEESLVDIWSPCISGITPLPGSEVVPPFVISASICDICEGTEFATGVDSASIVLTLDGVDVTSDITMFPIDCYGWAVSLTTDFLTEGEHEVCLWAYDFAGNAVDTCWNFYAIIPDTLVSVEIIEPFDGAFSACDDQNIVALFVDGIASVPDDFSFTVGDEEYDLSSSEVTVIGDTLIFSPSTSWEDGDIVYYSIGSAAGYFVIDLSEPIIELEYPDCDDTLSSIPDYISVYFGDMLSGIDESSIVVTVNAIVFTADSPGVYWDTGMSTLIIDPVAAGLSLDGEVEVCGMATDSPDYCTPNSAVFCCNFTVLPPHPYYIAGQVIDTSSGLPLEGYIVAAFHIFGLPFVEHAVTDADGRYCIEVSHGTWIAAAFDPTFTNPPIFWEGHPYPFDADPIMIPPEMGDTFWANFEFSSPATSLFRVAGTVQDESSEPIRGAVVVFIATGDEGEELGISSGITDSLGAFSIPVATGKNYYVRAFADGYKQSSHTGRWNWDVSDSMIITGDISDLEFTLAPEATDSGGSSIYGTVYREFTIDEEPMRGVLVCLCDIATEEPLYCEFSDFEGNYEIDNVPDGTYKLMADRPLYTIQGDWETVVLPDTNSHDIYLQRYTGIAEWTKTPEQMVLRGAKPNPFNTSTSIEFYIPASGNAKLEIVDISGHTVATLFDGKLNRGNYVSVWSAEDVPSGIYFVKLNWNGYSTSQKILFTK